jgi:uncharacterized protein YjbI with pentapeptide repeats
VETWNDWREHHPGDRVDLAEANLSDFHEEQGTDLTEADLTGADLTGADLSWADLSGANLSGASNLTQEQIEVAKGNEQTKLPDHLELPASWSQK